MREGQEIEVQQQTSTAVITRAVLIAAAEQRKLLAEYVNSQMVKGTDYGEIPGTNKPTLLKPGAEKLTDLFRCTPKFKLIKEVEDYDRNLFAYTFRVQLFQRDAAAVLAEGFGSANSREGRYRWRNAQPKCPVCGKESLFRSKKDPGFYCWAKKGGCGAKFGEGDAKVKAAFDGAGRVENDDVATLANTILKVAKKRALVDGAIALARVSDLFTQDVEDMEQHGSSATETEERREEESRTSKEETPLGRDPRLASKEDPSQALCAKQAKRMATAKDVEDLAIVQADYTELASKKEITAAQVGWLEGILKKQLERIGGGK